MKNLILGLVSVFGLAIFMAAATQRVSPDPSSGQAAFRPGLWPTYQFREAGQPATYEYNVALTCQAAGRPLQARLVFDWQDTSNYKFLEINDQGVRLARVESDFEMPLGWSKPLPLPEKENVQILLQRHRPRMTVFVNDQLAAMGSEESARPGPLFLGSPNDSLAVSSVRIQPVSEVFFSDDFMKPAGETGEWGVVCGDWKVKSLKNPSLSANAFTYEGHSSGRPGITLAGHRFWNNYRFRAAVSGAGCGDIGLIFYHQSAENYYLFRWGAGSEPAQGRPARQLCHFFRNSPTLLAEAPGGYQPGQWYILEIQLCDQRIRALIDDAVVFDVRSDAYFSGGKIGLYSECRKPGCPLTTRFDDVEVTTLRDFFEDFSRASAIAWTPMGGDWQISGETCYVRSQAAGHFITGLTEWKNYQVHADVTAGTARWIGILAAYLDEASYLLYRVSPCLPGSQELVHVRDAKSKVLSRVEGMPSGWKQGSNRIRLELNSGVVSASVNGSVQMEAWLGPGLSGKAGLYAEEAEGSSFDNVEVRFLQPPKPVLYVNPVFAHEKSMSNWAGAESDWVAHAALWNATEQDLRTHRMEFMGDVEFALTVEQDAQLQSLRLILAGDDQNTQGGYQFTVNHASGDAPTVAPTSPPATEYTSDHGRQETAAPPKGWTARLTRQNHEVASTTLGEGILPKDFRLRRAGSHVIAFVNSEAVLHYRDPEPLAGRRISYQNRGGKIRPETIHVFSPQAWCYSFRQAITDWRIAAGEWEVTSRWQCDPRWTFFSGYGRRLACIWNKREFPGDVCVDFAAGIKMDRNRGNRYEYARDINVTLCADGKDLTSGYSFLFGGYENSRTCILRQNKIVAQCAEIIPIHSNIHRRWFHIKVARRGNTLLYWIDDRLVLQYEDADPLSGDQMALWTWENGMMVAQVRISCPAPGELESPDRPLAANPACIYP